MLFFIKKLAVELDYVFPSLDPGMLIFKNFLFVALSASAPGTVTGREKGAEQPKKIGIGLYEHSVP